MAWQLSFKVTSTHQQVFFFFFFFFLCCSWKYDNGYNGSESCVFLTTTFFKLWMGTRESWRQQQVVFFFQHFSCKTKKERRKQNQQCKWNHEKKKPLKQQQEAIDNSCVAIYSLTLQHFTGNTEKLQTPLAEEERVLIFQAVTCKLKNTCEVDNSVGEKHVFSQSARQHRFLLRCAAMSVWAW